MKWLSMLLVAASVALLLSDPREHRLRIIAGHRPQSPAQWLNQFRHAVTQRFAVAGAHRSMRTAIVDVAEGWAAELRAGRVPVDALVRAIRDGSPQLAALADAIELGSDVPAALARASSARGAEGLRVLGSCWIVGAESGASLAPTVERVAKALRDDLDRRQEVDAQLAAPRSTARLLAALPLAGPLLGAVMGVSTIEVLVATNPGRACLAGGLVLTAAGTWWTRQLAASAVKSA